jgi:threonine/homoserine/homoserine lactone efflux protein
MEKWLCWVAMGVSGFLLLLFLLDLIIGIPFSGMSSVVDIIGLISCAAVLYLGWDASRDLR